MPSSAWKKKERRIGEHTSELQSHSHLVCRLLLEKKTRLRGGVTSAGDAGERRARLGGVSSVFRHAAVAADRTVLPSSLRLILRILFFFFKEAAPPEILLFPPTAPPPL